MLSLFGDGSWENSLQRVAAKDEETGELVELQLDKDLFREFISILE